MARWIFLTAHAQHTDLSNGSCNLVRRNYLAQILLIAFVSDNRQTGEGAMLLLSLLLSALSGESLHWCVCVCGRSGIGEAGRWLANGSGSCRIDGLVDLRTPPAKRMALRLGQEINRGVQVGPGEP
jgi:hypothetical protein